MHQGSSLCILSVIEMASVGARQRQEGCVESNWIVNLFQSCGPARVEEHEKNSEEHQAASRGEVHRYVTLWQVPSGDLQSREHNRKMKALESDTSQLKPSLTSCGSCFTSVNQSFYISTKIAIFHVDVLNIKY